MDWPLKDPAFFDQDLDDLYRYEPQRSKAVYRFEGDEDITECWLDTDQDVSRWLEKVTEQRSRGRPGLAVILAARAEQPDNPHNPAILEYLPFSRKSFEKIVTCLPLHGDTARVVNRYNMAFFTSIDLLDSPANAIFHILRTTATHPGDLALSSVSHPTTTTTTPNTNTNTTTTPSTPPSPPSFFTTALLLGCTPTDTTTLTSRLACASPSAHAHPLLLPGIVAELERTRHADLVRDRVFHLLRRVRALGVAVPSSSSGSGSSGVGEVYSVDLWIEVWQLRMVLLAWGEEVRKMEGEVQAVVGVCGETETGVRIRKRLGEIRAEYEGFVRECSMVIEGMALSAQLSWSQIGYQDTQVNLKIASDTREDSNQMRSIAFLTMVFLPATFLAAVFSMTFFNWKPGEGERFVSPYIAIYIGLAVVVTAVVLSCWIWFTRRNRVSYSGDDEKTLLGDCPTGVV